MTTVLDEIVREALMDGDAADSESGVCRSFKIDSASYIKWVQRSLNRLLRTRLRADGRNGNKTRAAVGRFQQAQRLSPTGRVDQRTQNRLILGNEKNRLYMRWIQETLNRGGETLAVDGRKGSKTKAAIGRFQRKPARQLCADGFVGAKTELRLSQAGGGVPPRSIDACGVPRRAVLDEVALELEIEELESSSRSGPRPRLCLFQNYNVSSHRNHFRCGALKQARQIRAIASPDTADCRRRVGPTAYDTGADIIAAIEAAHQCLGDRAVDRVHVFSHGYSSGIPGTTSGFVGLYRNDFGSIEHDLGGRFVSEVPTAPLSERVRFVLHGCNMAAGNNNVARSLYEHLTASLDDPRVFGHHNGGCSGRNNGWREYSDSHPTGRRRSSLSNIVSTGCCS